MPVPAVVVAAPLAAAQPSSASRNIDALHIAGGRLFVGYGSISDNAGPIHVLSLDLADVGAGLTDEAALHTEQISRYVPTSLGLVAPFTDPMQGIGNPEEGSYAVRQPDGSWVTIAERLSPYPVHIFDMAETSAELLAFGSSLLTDGGQSYGQVWTSADAGESWESSLQVPSASDDLVRFRTACVLDDQAVGFVVDLNADTYAAHLRDGDGWTALDAPNVYLALAWSHGGVPHAFCLPNGYVWTLPGDDGTAAQAAWDALAASPVVACVSSSGSHLYVLAFDGRVLRHDGTAWETAVTVNIAGLRGMAVDDAHGFVYFGTTDSHVVRQAL